MKELRDDKLDSISGGINVNSIEEDTKAKWAKAGIIIVQVNGFPEYYLIKDGTKISPKKALEIYTTNGGII